MEDTILAVIVKGQAEQKRPDRHLCPSPFRRALAGPGSPPSIRDLRATREMTTGPSGPSVVAISTGKNSFAVDGK